MAVSSTLSVVLVTVAAFIVTRVWLDRRQTSVILPPGPKGLPLIGNINDLPPPDVPEYQHWLQHREKYGPLSSITVLGQVIVIIHDKEVAIELMERRASRYSGRPTMKFVFDM
jgi:hypothetical protein